MEYMQIIGVPAIALVVYWVIELIKYTTKENEAFKRFIPLTAAALGAILGIVLFFTVPEVIAASNGFVAFLSGAASGLSATGFNQIIKQMSLKDTTKKDDNNDGDSENNGGDENKE